MTLLLVFESNNLDPKFGLRQTETPVTIGGLTPEGNDANESRKASSVHDHHMVRVGPVPTIPVCHRYKGPEK